MKRGRDVLWRVMVLRRLRLLLVGRVLVPFLLGRARPIRQVGMGLRLVELGRVPPRRRQLSLVERRLQS